MSWDRFPHCDRGAVVRVIIQESTRRVSKQKGKPGEREELFAGTRARPD